MANLSTKDKEKPFILIGAVIAGIIIQTMIGKAIPALIQLTEIGVFFVILSVMLPVEIKDVGKAFRKVKPTTLAIVINFIFIPLFSWAMGWVFLKNYPDFWVGAILYTLTPCIGWYLIFTDLAEGDVAWGIALLPWNITLQIVLMPLYMYILVGRIIPIDFAVLARSVGLFLIAPFILGYIIQKAIIRTKGREYFFGSFKKLNGEFKLWALVLVILSMFVSQPSITFSDAGRVGLLILFLILFFFVLFVLAMVNGKLFKLGYADTVTLSFTTTARNSEAIIGVAVAAFPGHPLVYLAIILGPIVELPMLLLLSRALLSLKSRF
ncbi:MAG: bile acid:sodium symporter [Gallionella sp.]